MHVRDFYSGRSAIYADHGIAATASPRATLAALDMLRSGGNAVDAALTAIAMLCVIEQGSTGIGGDCFVLYSPKAGKPIGLNGSGRAPAAATAAWYAAKGIKKIEMQTPHAVTVPGAIDAVEINEAFAPVVLAWLKETGADPARHVHVGASLFHDAVPAETLGLPMVWINREAELATVSVSRQLPTLTGLADALDSLVPE